jgi:hypothetical protein
MRGYLVPGAGDPSGPYQSDANHRNGGTARIELSSLVNGNWEFIFAPMQLGGVGWHTTEANAKARPKTADKVQFRHWYGAYLSAPDPIWGNCEVPHR